MMAIAKCTIWKLHLTSLFSSLHSVFHVLHPSSSQPLCTTCSPGLRYSSGKCFTFILQNFTNSTRALCLAGAAHSHRNGSVFHDWIIHIEKSFGVNWENLSVSFSFLNTFYCFESFLFRLILCLRPPSCRSPFKHSALPQTVSRSCVSRWRCCNLWRMCSVGPRLSKTWENETEPRRWCEIIQAGVLSGLCRARPCRRRSLFVQLSPAKLRGSTSGHKALTADSGSCIESLLLTSTPPLPHPPTHPSPPGPSYSLWLQLSRPTSPTQCLLDSCKMYMLLFLYVKSKCWFKSFSVTCSLFLRDFFLIQIQIHIFGQRKQK